MRPSKLVSVVQAWSDCENQLHDLRTEIFCSLILPSFPLHGNSEVSALVTIAEFLFVRYNFKLNSLWVNWRAEHVFESTTNQETFDQCLQRLDAAIFLSSRILSVQYASLAPEGKFWPIFVCVHEWRYWKKFRSRDAPAYLYLAQRTPYVREVMWACKLSEVEVSIHKQKSRSIWVIQLRR